jgi:hypothetical protein
MKRICVFCGSSTGARAEYSEAARAIARAIVASEAGLVYGGGNVGLMGVLADAALAAGGEVIGVIPEFLGAKEIAHGGLTEMRVVGSMHERKAMMAELSDAFIAMPGGFGTFDEFCEIITWNQLGLQRKPFALLNTAGYYDALLQMFLHAEQERFVKPQHRGTIIVESDPAALMQKLLACEMPEPTRKWFDGEKS